MLLGLVEDRRDLFGGVLELSISVLATQLTDRFLGVRLQSTCLAKYVVAISHDRVFEVALANATTCLSLIVLIGLDLIITLVFGVSACKFFPLLRFPFLIQLVARLVVPPVMDVNTRVAKRTVAVLVVVLAPFRVIVHSRHNFSGFGTWGLAASQSA